MNQTILILDFGSQYTQLIARRIRELSVYSEIHPYNKIPELGSNIKGIILSGSPFSVLDDDAPTIDVNSLRNRYPILGICYGAQYLSHNLGGKVEKSTVREYGRANLSYIDKDSVLFKNVELNSQVWMSHADTITQVPDSFSIIASTADVKVAAYKINNENTFGLQFHPEVYHSTDGKTILQNFVLDVCRCEQTWTPKSYISEMVSKIKNTVGDQNVILGLSGGVDSTVCAVLLHKAIGKHLHCIFIDNGLLRKNEFSSVLDSYKGMGLNVKGVDAGNKFLTALKGITDPEAKRKAIGRTFIEVFDEEAKKIDNANWLAQGTIYPDVIESVSVKGPSVSIKSHHNVGGLPDYMKLKLVEPLRMLFKDEVRKIGTELNIDPNILNRHPFPGPGLGIRILGDITADKVKIIQEADYIFIDLLKKRGLYEKVWQAAAILLPIKSVGVMGDERTYENVVALRAVTSTDGMTADWYHLPYDFLSDVSNLIINKVKGINRVVYDISSKPPATIEWE
ncbi:MAG: glutamine-hydrolyzing GMP synthase [Bacteroidales bacterium]|jgi:GMP synthase (glutamine-hydrolysing)